MSASRKVVALSGGVGGARLAHGLSLALAEDPAAPTGASSLTILVNTGDDFRHYGLHISPDLDTVLYTLAGRADPATGWGLAGDTDAVMRAARALGEDTWFHLGDGDLALHLLRTERLARGETLTAVTRHLSHVLGIGATVLPVCDDPVPTLIRTASGLVDFQTWFVRQRCQPPATGVAYPAARRRRPTSDALQALATADILILGPSNPYLSIGPLLALDRFRSALTASPARRVAVSPLLGGQAVKGPAADMLRDLAGAATNLALAQLYVDFIDGLVIDHADAADEAALADLGLAVLVTGTLVPDAASRRRLAEETLAFAAGLG